MMHSPASLAQFLNAHVSTLSPAAAGTADGIIWGIATARIAGVAVMAIRAMSDAEIVALVDDVVNHCELQCDVPRYINERFCPVLEPLVIPGRVQSQAELAMSNLFA